MNTAEEYARAQQAYDEAVEKAAIPVLSAFQLIARGEIYRLFGAYSAALTQGNEERQKEVRGAIDVALLAFAVASREDPADA